jgi:signal transduction histidine kinase
MKNVIIRFVLAAGMASFANAGDHGTPEEAKAMVLKAAEFAKSHGMEEAKAAFEDLHSEWHDRDLYVYVYKVGEPIVISHGKNPAIAGKNLSGLKDVDGKHFPREIAAIKDEAWVDYKWQTPGTKTIEAKTAFCKNIEIGIVCAGAYKQ